MANSSDIIDFRRFGSISVEFFTNNMLRVNDFGRCEVLSFHFEEGISHPYTGILDLVTQNALNFSKLDLDYLYVKISYNVNYIYEHDESNANSGDFRTVWALIKTVTNLPKAERANPFNADEKFNYQYQLILESPLSRLKSTTTIFKNLTITEILRDLLSRAAISEGNIYNPLLCAVNFSKIRELHALDTRELEIQRGQEDTLAFFNRILIGYGINYILDFDAEKGVKLIFSCDQKYRDSPALNCTDNQHEAAQRRNNIYFTSNILQKNSVQFDKARAFAKMLKNSWLNFEMSRTDTSGAKERQIKFIYKNLCIRKLAVNPRLSSQCVQDIRLTPGLLLNSWINDIESKYIVVSVTTDISSFNKNARDNAVLLKTDCLELVDHGAIAELDDKSDGDHFEFDAKRLLGSLVHQDVTYFEALENKQNLDILEAKACAKDGSINESLTADYADDKAENNDLFYAVITSNNDKVVIKVHTLIEANSSSVKKVMQGQRILVMSKGGAYYLYGYVPQPICINDDQRDGIRQELMNLNKDSSLSLMTFKNNREYIYSLLKRSAKHVEDAVIVQALESNNTALHDDTYVKTYNKQVVDLHNDYASAREKYQKALEALNNKYADGQLILSRYYSGNRLNKDAPQELKEVNSCKDAYDKACEKLYALAGKIVTDCKINFTKGDTKEVVVYDNSDGYKILSGNGNFDVTAENITLNASSKIFLNAPDIELSGSNSVKSHVGLSTVVTSAESTRISTGATFSCAIPDAEGNNAADLISSSFCVGTSSGISGNAFSVKFAGNHLLSLSGPLKSGIMLNYGSVKVVGSEFKVLTQGRFEQYRNIVQASKTMICDIIQSCAGLKNNMVFQLVSNGLDDVGNLYDAGVGNLGILGVGRANKQKFDKNKSAFRGVDKQGKELSRGEKARGCFDVLDAIMQCLLKTADWILFTLKRVMKYQEIIYNSRSKDNPSYQKFVLMTPFNQSALVKRLDQVELYISYIKMFWSILAAGFKASQAAYGFIPSVSEFSINSTKAEIKSQTISLTHHREAEFACAPAQGTCEHTIRENISRSETDDFASENKVNNVDKIDDMEDEFNVMKNGGEGRFEAKDEDGNPIEIKNRTDRENAKNFFEDGEDGFDDVFGDGKKTKNSNAPSSSNTDKNNRYDDEYIIKQEDLKRDEDISGFEGFSGKGMKNSSQNDIINTDSNKYKKDDFFLDKNNNIFNPNYGKKSDNSNIINTNSNKYKKDDLLLDKNNNSLESGGRNSLGKHDNQLHESFYQEKDSFYKETEYYDEKEYFDEPKLHLDVPRRNSPNANVYRDPSTFTSKEARAEYKAADNKRFADMTQKNETIAKNFEQANKRALEHEKQLSKDIAKQNEKFKKK